MTDSDERSEETAPYVSGELRDVRYCEVIPVTREGRQLTAWVYNTLGLNDCPAEEWDALTEEEVNEAYGSVSAKLNGPRYWVMDQLVGFGSTSAGGRFTFGGIEMGLRASVDTELESVISEIAARYDPLLKQAGLLSRLRLRRQMKREIEREIELRAPRAGVYVRA